MPFPTRASAADIAAYAQREPRPLYPLSHWVRIDGPGEDGKTKSFKCAVERIGAVGRIGDRVSDDPKYEIIAPEGFHFDEDSLHTMLCFDLADARDRSDFVELVKCNDHCPPA